MPWKDIGQQPNLQYISVGKDTDGSLYEKELKEAICASMGEDSSAIRFLIPCAQNWPSWDAVLVVRREEERGAVHVVFLQMTVKSDYEIYARGLNLVRDAIPVGLTVHYHYVLILLAYNETMMRIPKWKHVSASSAKPKEKDLSWHRDNLREYIMFVRMKDLFKPPAQD